MKRIGKLLILIIISTSVYFIYQSMEGNYIRVLNIGDGLSKGINSYGGIDASYADYYKQFFTHKKIEINNEYSKKTLTIDSLLEIIKNYPEFKRAARESNIVFLNIGYTDLLYRLSTEENISDTRLKEIIQEMDEEYQELLKELKKYYKGRIITIGYYDTRKEDLYLKKGIVEWNKVLEKHSKNDYIDTYNLLKNKKKYFSNPSSYYPNYLGYQAIANKIIEKTLEK